MKKTISLVSILFFALISSSLFGQGIVAKGFIGGVNLANVSGEDIEDNDSKIGFAIGGFLTFGLNKQLALRPEIYFSSKGFSSETEESDSESDYEYSYTSESTISLNYIEVPILGVFMLNENLNLFAGPYFDIYLSGEGEEKSEGSIRYYNGYEWTTENFDESESNDIESDDVNSPGFGLVFGAEYIMNQFSFGARYSLGLSNIPDEDDVEFKHSVIQFMVGFYL